MRKRKKANPLKYIIIIISVIMLLSVSSYIIFFKTTNINGGILIEKEHKKTVTLLRIYDNGSIKWVKVSNSINLPDSLAYNIKLKGIFLSKITPAYVRSGKADKISKDYITISGLKYSLSDSVLFYKLNNGMPEKTQRNSLIVGINNAKYIFNSENKIFKIVMDSPSIDKIRVGISNADFTSKMQYHIIFYSKRPMQLDYDSSHYKTQSGEYISCDYKNGSMLFSLLQKNSSSFSVKSTIGIGHKRACLTPSGENSITVVSLKRANGYIPSYSGSFEISPESGALSLINVVPLENYIQGVVPSEMLPSGGIEAYKVQAVAARTYALSDMFAGRFAKYGYHVDDTTQSQVYNSLPSSKMCQRAVEDTSGQIMTYSGSIIDAKYYSTSCGVGSAFGDVWYKDSMIKNNPEPYLDFNDYSGTGITSLENEDTAAVFLKDWTIKACDSNSPFFRWKITFDRKQFNSLISSNLYKLYREYPSSFYKKWIFGIYKNTEIESSGIGTIYDINVSKRGKGGNVQEIVLTTDQGDFKIKKESILKKLFKSNTLEITPLYGSVMKNMNYLPSGFFVFDKEFKNNKIKTLTIYGGGFGHGVGMSQYGVIGYVRQGKDYQYILHTFYKNISFENYNKVVEREY